MNTVANDDTEYVDEALDVVTVVPRMARDEGLEGTLVEIELSWNTMPVIEIVLLLNLIRLCGVGAVDVAA